MSQEIIISYYSIVEPKAPSQLRAISLSATSIQLQWKEESNGHSPILRYKLEYQNGTNKWERFPGLKIEPSTLFMVRNLRPNTGYQFRIRAINSIGYSLWSEPSAIITTHLQGTDSMVNGSFGHFNFLI